MEKTITPTRIAIAIILFVGLFSATHLTAMPRIFFDEALTIEIARNMELYGVLDILTEPGKFSGVPYITGSSGYPITLPLALFFKLFGFGFFQARIYALTLLLATLIVSWFFVKQFWNDSYATAGLALITGFASLHDSGRRVMGDIPGFALLLLGLYLLIKKDRPYIAGLFFGLAIAAKPSVYLLIIPALIITHLLTDWRSSLRKLLPIGIGVLLPTSAWILLQFPNPLSGHTWQMAISFYKNAYGSSYSFWVSFIQNIKSFGSQSTLIYFSLLAIPTFFAFKEKFIKRDWLTIFFFSYGLFDLIYFLKSPGTIRYLLPLQLILLLLLPATISWAVIKLQELVAFTRKISPQYLAIVAITSLASLHFVQFLFFSSVPVKNTAHLDVLNFLTRYKTETIGVVSSPHIAAFISPTQKLHYLRLTDQIIFGINPLSLPLNQLPDVVVIPNGYIKEVPLSPVEKGHLERYSLAYDGKWQIYELTPR